MKTLTRRTFLKVSGLGAALLGVACAAALALVVALAIPERAAETSNCRTAAEAKPRL